MAQPLPAITLRAAASSPQMRHAMRDAIRDDARQRRDACAMRDITRQPCYAAPRAAALMALLSRRRAWMMRRGYAR